MPFLLPCSFLFLFPCLFCSAFISFAPFSFVLTFFPCFLSFFVPFSFVLLLVSLSILVLFPFALFCFFSFVLLLFSASVRAFLFPFRLFFFGNLVPFYPLSFFLSPVSLALLLPPLLFGLFSS